MSFLFFQTNNKIILVKGTYVTKEKEIVRRKTEEKIHSISKGHTVMQVSISPLHLDFNKPKMHTENLATCRSRRISLYSQSKRQMLPQS